MMHIGLKPAALLREKLRFKSGKVASHIGCQAGFAHQGIHHSIGRREILLHLVEHIHGIHLHTLNGFGNALRMDVPDT